MESYNPSSRELVLKKMNGFIVNRINNDNINNNNNNKLKTQNLTICLLGWIKIWRTIQ